MPHDIKYPVCCHMILRNGASCLVPCVIGHPVRCHCAMCILSVVTFYCASCLVPRDIVQCASCLVPRVIGNPVGCHVFLGILSAWCHMLLDILAGATCYWASCLMPRDIVQYIWSGVIGHPVWCHVTLGILSGTTCYFLESTLQSKNPLSDSARSSLCDLPI